MTQDNTKLRETLVEILLIDDQVSVNNNLLDELEALIAREVEKALQDVLDKSSGGGSWRRVIMTKLEHFKGEKE